MANERRRHVRVRPAVELPVDAHLVEGADPGRLQVVDLSLGGIAFQTAGGLRTVAIGAELVFHLAFGEHPPVALRAIVRHSSGSRPGLTGVEVAPGESEGRKQLRRYVTELFERGLSV